jgi:hypothetical protein
MLAANEMSKTTGLATTNTLAKTVNRFNRPTVPREENTTRFRNMRLIK